MKLLTQKFYAKDAQKLAQELLGKIIVCNNVSVSICETEAYIWPNDSANHCFNGQTKRNAMMFGDAGHAYIYLCYGMHNMLNFVSNQKGEGAAVLVRAAIPILGLAHIEKRRGSQINPSILAGPGKLCQALAIDRDLNGSPLYLGNNLSVYEAAAPKKIISAPRIGIKYANKKDREAKLRFAIADCPYVSHLKAFKPV